MNKRIIKNISALWGGTILTSILGFLSQSLIARSISSHDYGVWTSSLSIINLVIPFIGFGIAPYLLKVFGEEGEDAFRWMKPTYKFLYISSSSILFFILLWAYIGPHDEVTKKILIILSGTIFTQAILELYRVKLQLEEKFQLLAIWQLVIPVLKIIGLITLIVSQLITIYTIALLFLGNSLIVLVLLLKEFFSIKKGNIKLIGHNNSNSRNNLNSQSIIPLVKGCWKFGFVGVFYLIWSQSTVVFLKYLSSNSDAGVYSVALMIMTAICLLPTVIYNKYLLPKIHRWANQDPNKLRDIYRKGNKYMLLISVVASASVVFLSGYVIPLFFGSGYSESIYLLKILAISIPFRYIGHSPGSILVVKENISSKTKIMCFVTIISSISNILLIPKFGPVGAAYISVFVEFLLFILYFFKAQKFLNNKFYL